MDDAQLEALLFPRAVPHIERHATPDFAHLHQELKRKGVTLMLLWEEYAAAHAGQAYRYSQFGIRSWLKASWSAGPARG